MRVDLFFLLVCIAFCTYGCSDESTPISEQIVEIIDTDNVVSVPESAVTAPTVEVWEALRLKREYVLRQYQRIGRDVVGAEKFDTEVAHVAEVKARQEAFYTKYIDAEGIAIVANDDVADKHLIEARRVVLTMTSKYPELRDRLQVQHGFYLVLIGSQTLYSFVPELGDGKTLPGCSTNTGPRVPGVVGYCFAPLLIPYWYNEETQKIEFVSPESPHQTKAYLQTFAHEFAHGLDYEMRLLDPTFHDRRITAYRTAHERGTWAGLYADVNYAEYWAEGVEIWFYDIGPGRKFETYEAFSERDPLLAELLAEWFPKVALPRYY